MKSIIRKNVAGLLCSAMLLTYVPFSIHVPEVQITANAAASSYTAAQGASWAIARANESWHVDVDGSFGCQCVDLILAYYKYLVGTTVAGNATDYQKNTLPSGWKRVTSNPQPGDICVWAGNTKINAGYTLNQYGHIGIVAAVNGSNLTTVETRGGNGEAAAKYTRNASYVTCYIRPNFKDTPAPSYDAITQGNYYLKNASTGTYLTISGAKAADGQAAVLAAKKDTNAFKFYASGSKTNGYYLISLLNKSYVLNPYSDTPGDGTKITLYTKNTDGTQLFQFKKSGSGYLIYSASAPDCVLTASGSNVLLKTNTSAAAQIWTLENADKQLKDITVSASKTEYLKYETLQASDYTVTANYSDGTSQKVTSGFTAEADFSKTGKQSVTVSFTSDGVTKKASYEVTVSEPFAGKGTPEEPYLIQNKENLEMLANLLNHDRYPVYNTLCYQQTADIDLNNEVWTPIGCFYKEGTTDTFNSNNAFNGIYDGNNHQIYNLYVKQTSNYSGLFGRINASAKICNLAVTGSISGTNCAGGIVGEMGYGAVVKACTFSGIVNGTSLVGGITGKIQGGGTILNCYSNAVVSVEGDSAGGICGCILTGNADTAVNGQIFNCYSAGTVTGASSGAITGTHNLQDKNAVTKNTVSYQNCYYLSSVNPLALSDMTSSDIQKLSEEELKKSAAVIMPDGLLVSASASQNDGFPIFKWLSVAGDINQDNSVSTLDAVSLQKYLHSSEVFSKEQWEAADLNHDGNVNIYDLILLKKMLLSK